MKYSVNVIQDRVLLEARVNMTTKIRVKKNITSSVYDCTIEDVEHSNI